VPFPVRKMDLKALEKMAGTAGAGEQARVTNLILVEILRALRRRKDF